MTRRTEGPLGDTENQSLAQRQAAKARRILANDLLELKHIEAFRRWLGKYAAPVIMQDLATTNGGDIQKFMGRRALVLDMIQEFEEVEPGFYERVLQTRRAFANALNEAPPPRNEES